MADARRAGPARAHLVVAVLLAVAFAGCSAPEPGTTSTTMAPRGVTLDLATPGRWHLNGNTDHIMAWIHNGGRTNVTYAWSLTLSGGRSLPAGWEFSAFPSEGRLEPSGSRVVRGNGYSYGDWHRAVLSLRIPADMPPTLVAAELHAGNVTQAIEILVNPDRGVVAAVGDSVRVEWVGRFHSNGTTFGNGTAVVHIGASELLPGFEAGVVGLAPGEEAGLVVPPAFAYGWDVPANRAESVFNGEWLEYDVRMLEFA